ncbi:hypothetical protein TNCV_2671801 [Trichonephila clavipes]|nr:hypothetical protein TNCV_2671801 [Trichonephila clavipes]
MHYDVTQPVMKTALFSISATHVWLDHSFLEVAPSQGYSCCKSCTVDTVDRFLPNLSATSWKENTLFPALSYYHVQSQRAVDIRFFVFLVILD